MTVSTASSFSRGQKSSQGSSWLGYRITIIFQLVTLLAACKAAQVLPNIYPEIVISANLHFWWDAASGMKLPLSETVLAFQEVAAGRPPRTAILPGMPRLWILPGLHAVRSPCG